MSVDGCVGPLHNPGTHIHISNGEDAVPGPRSVARGDCGVRERCGEVRLEDMCFCAILWVRRVTHPRVDVRYFYVFRIYSDVANTNVSQRTEARSRVRPQERGRTSLPRGGGSQHPQEGGLDPPR